MKPGPLCSTCPLESAPGPVWGVGPSSAKLAAIGMAPSTEELKNEAPFQGAAGVTLNLSLSRVGIDRSKVFVTNVVKCFVKAGLNLPSTAVKCCAPLLQKELDTLEDCTTYLTLGAEPFAAFTKKRFLTQTDGKGKYKKDSSAWLRGSPYIISKLRGHVIIPTVHPQYLNYTAHRNRFEFEADLEKAKRFAEGGGVLLDTKMNYSPSDEEVIEYVQKCLRLKDVGLDIETPEKAATDEQELVGSGVGKVDVIGLSCEIGEAIGVQPKQFHLLEPLFSDPSIRLFVFNALFDIYHLGYYYDIKCQVIDVMLALHELHSHFQTKNLAVALSLYTDLPFHKNLAKSAPDLYNAMDTYGVLWAGLRMLDRMKELGCYDHFLNFTNAGLPVVQDLRVHGPRANIRKAGQFQLICSRALAQYQAYWDKALPSVDWSSPKQLLQIFQKQKLPLRYAMRKDKKTGARKRTPTVDEGALELYRDKHNSQIAGLVLLLRKLKKAGEFCHIYQSDGFIRATYGLHFQKQGRIQTRNPDLQNTPEGLVANGFDEDGRERYLVRPREIVVGDTEDDAVLVSDYSQIELRLFAKQADEKELVAEIAKGTYIYGLMYERIYKKPFFVGVPEGGVKLKKYKAPYVTPKQLLVAKTGPLGWIYGREDFTGAGLTKQESIELKLMLVTSFPGIHSFHQKLDFEVRRRGYLQNPFGRLRWIANPAVMRNEYLSFMGQGTAVDIILKNALIPLHKSLSQFGPRTRLIFHVYDSIGVMVQDGLKDPSLLNAVASHIKTYMESAQEELDGYSIPTEMRAGASWGTGQPIEV